MQPTRTWHPGKMLDAPEAPAGIPGRYLDMAEARSEIAPDAIGARGGMPRAPWAALQCSSDRDGRSRSRRGEIPRRSGHSELRDPRLAARGCPPGEPPVDPDQERSHPREHARPGSPRERDRAPPRRVRARLGELPLDVLLDPVRVHIHLDLRQAASDGAGRGRTGRSWL